MPTLRITVGDKGWTVAVDDLSASIPAATPLSEPDQEDLRWYFEDYVRFPFEPAPTIAARVERRMQEIGEQLFTCVFPNDETLALWTGVAANLAATRVEIVILHAAAEIIPWELMKAPGLESPIALNVQSFVRVARPRNRSGIQDAPDERTREQPFRILVAICRPRGAQDVPFRSVARHLIRSAGERAADGITLDVLRPATFANLKETLRAAYRRHEPYDVLHFDGHGAFRAHPGISIRRGHIVFEGSQEARGQGYVDGHELGTLLRTTGVRGLILNACRSAHAEVQPRPVRGGRDSTAPALGSLAHEAAAAGVPLVVAMRYNVHVATAAQFVSHVYAALGEGCTGGEAVASARRRMAANAGKGPLIGDRPFQDWAVPVVFEASPTRLFFHALPGAADEARAVPGASAAPTFVGRDGAILNLDRAFLVSPIVLLHSVAGDGKTATAREFAAWYARTGALGAGQVLYTSFAEVRSVAGLVDQLLPGPEMPDSPEGTRPVRPTTAGALRLLRNRPALWIWDDLDALDLLASAQQPAVATEELMRLDRFLAELKTTKAKVLIISRRSRIPWLSSTRPVPVSLPQMPLSELAELAGNIARERNVDLRMARAWLPLLRAADGHPQALRVFAEQVFDACGTPAPESADLEEVVSAVVSGDRPLPQDNDLHAGIAQWFVRAGPKTELPWFSLLHWFRSIVSPGDLQALALLPEGQSIPGLAALAERGEPCEAVLGEAADYGLFRRFAGSNFGLHPGLPSYLRSMAESIFPGPVLWDAATRAYVAGVSDLSCHMANGIIAGDGRMRLVLQLHEANLMHAWKIALQRDWLAFAVDLIQGLEEVLVGGGRVEEWRTMVECIESRVTHEGQPDQRWVPEWEMVQEYRLRSGEHGSMARDALDAARRLSEHRQRRSVDDLKPGANATRQEQDVFSRAVAIGEEGLALLQRGEPSCLARFDEAEAICTRLGAAGVSAIIRIQLNRSRAYSKLGAIRDFARAEASAQSAIALARQIESASELAVAALALFDVRLERLKDLVARGASKQAYTRPYLAVQQAIDLAQQYVLTTGSKPAQAEFYSLRGEWFYMQREDGKALADLQEAIALVGDRPRTIVDLRMKIANVLMSMGRRADARTYRQSARELADSLRRGADRGLDDGQPNG